MILFTIEVVEQSPGSMVVNGSRPDTGLPCTENEAVLAAMLTPVLSQMLKDAATLSRALPHVKVTHHKGHVTKLVGKTGLVTETETGPRILCLRCGSVSANPNDISKGYCGLCHMFHVVI